MLSTIGRAAVKRVVAAGPQSTNRAYHSIWQLQRAALLKGGDDGRLLQSNVLFTYTRSYATTTKATPKPKSKSSTTTKAKATAKPRAKKASTKKTVKVKAKKPVKKRVAKPKKKPTKKILSVEQKERAVIKTLREQALRIPKGKPSSPWIVYLVEQLDKVKGTPGNITAKSPSIRQDYKAVTPAELESLNHTANQNKAENEVMFKKWLGTHTPDQIRLANNARTQLKRKYKKHGLAPIPDSRLPKRPIIARSFFLKDRYATGELKGIPFGDAAKLIAREWTALSASERKVYEDRAAEDLHRYVQEFKTVYHRDPPTLASNS